MVPLLSVWMTPGRTEWGHQITRLVPPDQVAAYQRRGWRVYDAEYENSPASVLVPFAIWRAWRGLRAVFGGVTPDRK